MIRESEDLLKPVLNKESDGKGFLRIVNDPQEPFFYFPEVLMKAILVEEIGDFKIRDMATPRPNADEVLLKVSVTGLCRTDLKLIRAGHRDLVLPRIPGEEVVGTVEDTGRGSSGFFERANGFTFTPAKAVASCATCRAQAENLCSSMEIMGFHRHGGFAEYVVCSAKSLIPIPDGLSDEEAVFAEPLSCCVNALELSRLTKGETIGIWGAGPAGTLLARTAAALHAVPSVIDPDKRRSALAGGTTTVPAESFDVCIVAVGSDVAYEEALLHLKPRGRLVRLLRSRSRQGHYRD